MIKSFIKSLLLDYFKSILNRTYRVFGGKLTKILGYYNYAVISNLSSKANISKTMKIANSLSYSKPERHVQCFINGLHFLSNRFQEEIDILMIGYDSDTYDAQFLTKMGYKVNVYFVDIAPFNENSFIDTKIFNQFHYIQEDLRLIERHLGNKTFDYILTSRASIDSPHDCGLNYSTCFDFLKYLSTILKTPQSIILFHVISIISDYSFKLDVPDTTKDLLNTDMDPDNRIANRIIYVPNNSVIIDALSRLKEYSKKARITWIEEILNDKNISDREKIIKISVGENNNPRRYTLLDQEASLKVDWHATYLNSNTNTEKMPFYMSNILLIKQKMSKL
jgi:hypothetical protein